MYKVTENYEATVNGGEKQLIPTKDALIIIGDYQMHLKKDVREMTYSNGVAHIILKDGTVIDLRPAVEETAEEPKDWSITRTRGVRHRFNLETNQARCNKGIRPHWFIAEGGYKFRTRSDVEGYTLCPRCAAL